MVAHSERASKGRVVVDPDFCSSRSPKRPSGRLPPLSPRPWRIGNAAPRDKLKDWLLNGAIEADEKMAMDLAGPGYHINRSNLLVLESKSDMQKRGQAVRTTGTR
jgi:hypothetical protein